MPQHYPPSQVDKCQLQILRQGLEQEILHKLGFKNRRVKQNAEARDHDVNIRETQPNRFLCPVLLPNSVCPPPAILAPRKEIIRACIVQTKERTRKKHERRHILCRVNRKDRRYEALRESDRRNPTIRLPALRGITAASQSASLDTCHLMVSR